MVITIQVYLCMYVNKLKSITCMCMWGVSTHTHLRFCLDMCRGRGIRLHTCCFRITCFILRHLESCISWVEMYYKWAMLSAQIYRHASTHLALSDTIWFFLFLLSLHLLHGLFLSCCHLHHACVCVDLVNMKLCLTCLRATKWLLFESSAATEVQIYKHVYM